MPATYSLYRYLAQPQYVVLTRKSLCKAWREDFLVARLLVEKEHRKSGGTFLLAEDRRFGLF
jgi:hypothetical protein